MRAPACALAALSFAIALSAPASAQPYGQSDDGYRSSPPPYFTDRPPSRGPERDDDRPPPPSRSGQDSPWPPVPRGEPQRPPDERLGDSRPRPSEEHVVRRPPPVRTYRHEEPPPRSSEADRRPPPEREGQRVIVTKPPAPRPPIVRERVADREPDGPGARVMIGPNEMVISIAEYEDLRKQARELQRLLGQQSDRRDERRGTTTIYR